MLASQQLMGATTVSTLVAAKVMSRKATLSPAQTLSSTGKSQLLAAFPSRRNKNAIPIKHIFRKMEYSQSDLWTSLTSWGNV
mmetsp:Transcript_87579/g.165061  ORF Transcript_87579/g.165061 Transcript_87579/m.165061 type:complete len:82 (+) Transcript_87579:127-372(+)